MNLPVGMQSVSFRNCDGITGTAESRMSDGHIYLIFFSASRTRFLIPHLPCPSLCPPFRTGEVDKIVLPDGMQSVNFEGCTGITGTAKCLG